MKIPKLFLFFSKKIYTFVSYFENAQDFTGLSGVGIWTISNLIWIKLQ